MNKRDEQIDNLVDTFIGNIQSMVGNEKKFLNECENLLEYKFNEINKILRDLSLQPYSLPQNKTLLAQLKVLDNKLNELKSIKEERMEQLGFIADKLKKCCKLLGQEYVSPILITNIPSESELMDLRSDLKSLQEDLHKRRMQLETSKRIISKIVKAIDYKPRNEKERMAIECDKDEFVYSNENMSFISSFNNHLIHSNELLENQLDELTRKAQELFNRLEVPTEEQNEFFSEVKGSLPQKIEILKAEIEQLEIIKKENMEKIITSIRNDYFELLEKCKASEYNADLFNCEEFTEDLLNEHEEEYEKLSKFYGAFNQVFPKLDDWTDSLEQLLELEKKALDPNRFNNRGGSLLQNERDRRLLNKKLPRVEKEIKTFIKLTESKNNMSFGEYGFDLESFFEDLWNKFNQSKDDMKNKNSSKKVESTAKPSSFNAAASGQKSRVPFSPRQVNQIAKSSNTQVAKSLFPKPVVSSSKKRPAEIDETEFHVSISFVFIILIFG